MYKIIDLGHEVPETGEPRVQIVGPELVKTASTEIQKFWDSIQQDDRSAYLWVIGVSAMEYYGCNNNGDAFAEAELKNTHERFTENANVFLQHVNKDPAKGIGKPVFSWYNDAMHRVELVLRIDKDKPAAMETVRKIRAGEPIFVSMGCTVAYDQCSICGNRAKTRRDYCDHLRYNMKKILPDGRQVYALNPDPKFFDISIVSKPADPTAYTLDKMASSHFTKFAEVGRTSAELGEEAEDISLKLAALRKVSDIVKQVDGHVVDAKDPSVEAARNVAAQGFEDFGYPEMPYSSLKVVSPAGFLSCMRELDAPVTLDDAAWMSGRAILGRCPSRSEMGSMFSMLPSALSTLMERPGIFDKVLAPVLSSYNGEFENPQCRALTIRIMKPVAQVRISIVRGLAPAGALEKIGAKIDGHEHNFRTVKVRDEHGIESLTAPYFIDQAETAAIPGKILRGTATAALSLGAVAALLTEPTLARKLVGAAIFGVPALAVSRMGRPKPGDGKLQTVDWHEVPSRTLMESWKFQKTGSLSYGGFLGMAVPAAMALDYAHGLWKYAEEGDDSESIADRMRREFLDRKRRREAAAVQATPATAVPAAVSPSLKGVQPPQAVTPVPAAQPQEPQKEGFWSRFFSRKKAPAPAPTSPVPAAPASAPASPAPATQPKQPGWVALPRKRGKIPDAEWGKSFSNAEEEDDFRAWCEEMLGAEGVYSNLRNDPGGKTMYGLTWKDNQEFMPEAIQRGKRSFRSLTRAEAINIYRDRYWKGKGIGNAPREYRKYFADVQQNHGGRGRRAILGGAARDLGVADGVRPNDLQGYINAIGGLNDVKRGLIGLYSARGRTYRDRSLNTEASIRDHIGGWDKRNMNLLLSSLADAGVRLEPEELDKLMGGNAYYSRRDNESRNVRKRVTDEYYSRFSRA